MVTASHTKSVHTKSLDEDDGINFYEGLKTNFLLLIIFEILNI